jgi:hypothetical protein
MDAFNNTEIVPGSGSTVAMCPGNELPDFAWLSVAPESRLLKYRRPVQHDLKPTSTRRNQIDGRRRIAFP